jgi:hypothetical protein
MSRREDGATVGRSVNAFLLSEIHAVPQYTFRLKLCIGEKY